MRAVVQRVREASVRVDGEVTGALEALGARFSRGVFGADMTVSLVNDGPVTLVLDTPTDTPTDTGRAF